MKSVLTRRAMFALAAACLLPVGRAEDDRPVVADKGQSREGSDRGELPVLWIAGDSTVRNAGALRGWGQDLPRFLDAGKIQVANRAIGGRSARTFFGEGRWDAMLGGMRAGDLVLIQFGHNDGGPLDARGKFRGSLPGTGEGAEQVAKPDGSVETVRSYGWYLKHFARTAKAKGATVVLCSPVPHKKFDREGRFVRDWETLRGWVRECAVAEGVLYLDLAEEIGRRYAELPAAEIESFFADKGTHTNAAGSLFNARAVVAGLKALPPAPLEPFLNDEGGRVAALKAD